MPVPTTITDLAQVAASNYPQGTDSPSTLDDVQRAISSFIALLRDSKGLTSVITLASAATVDIGGANSYAVEITGTTSITSFGTNYSGPRHVRFTGALTLTHNASLLNLPGAANITTAAGDALIATPNSTGDGWNVTVYQRATGLALVSPTDYLNTTRIDVASAATVDLTANAPSTRHINITGTTAITGFTVAAGQTYFLRFNAALTLTNGASLVTQTGANITTAAGDTCIIRSTAANTVEVLAYSGNATDSQAGVVELATNAEAQAGTDATRAVTPAGVASMIFGVGQILQSVSRASGVAYTNNTGKPIQVIFQISYTGAQSFIYLNGAQVAAINGASNGNKAFSMMVPNGWTYQITDGAGNSHTTQEVR